MGVPIRRIHGSTLPPHGWAVSRPSDPPRCCSWCGDVLVAHSGVLLCRPCDLTERFPGSTVL